MKKHYYAFPTPPVLLRYNKLYCESCHTLSIDREEEKFLFGYGAWSSTTESPIEHLRCLVREVQATLLLRTNRETSKMTVNFYLRLARSQGAVKAEITFILLHLLQCLRTLSRDADAS